MARRASAGVKYALAPVTHKPIWTHNHSKLDT